MLRCFSDNEMKLSEAFNLDTAFDETQVSLGGKQGIQ